MLAGVGVEVLGMALVIRSHPLCRGRKRVTSVPSPILPETTVVLFCILLAPLAIAGLALINTGLGRSHSAAHTMLASLCVFAVAAACLLHLRLRLAGL